MAMTFTIASAAREALSGVIADRIRREKEEDDRRAREYEEVSYIEHCRCTQADHQAEAARTRGTPITTSTFDQWRKKFMGELQAKRDKEEDERVKALSPKEREEYKKKRDRPTGEFQGVVMS
jgi:hypothetical protein